jgi:hypothetical protein
MHPEKLHDYWYEYQFYRNCIAIVPQVDDLDYNDLKYLVIDFKDSKVI